MVDIICHNDVTGIDYYTKPSLYGMEVQFSELAEAYQRIEALSGRLEMTDELSGLLQDKTPEATEIIIRLTKGEVRPGYLGLDLGLAEKLAMKALYLVTMVPLDEIEELSNQSGDIGLLAEIVMKRKKQMSLFHQPLTIERVFNNLERIAIAKGKSSQDLKLKLVAEMLHDSSPEEAKYIARIVCGKMRLGIADMTVIDSLSYLYSPGFEEACEKIRESGSLADHTEMIETLLTRKTRSLNELLEFLKKKRKQKESGIEESYQILEHLKQRILDNREGLVRIFNVHPDLGNIGKILAESGMRKVLEMGVEPGIPLRAMLGERLTSVEDILEKMGGRSAFEYKYDGLRIQAHIFDDGGRRIVRMFSRQLEDITDQFPDVRTSIERSFVGRNAIIEGECVPVDPESGNFLPFQKISRRRGRKFELEEKIEEIPVLLVMFDCLFKDDVDLTQKPYLERRNSLAEVFRGLISDSRSGTGLSLSRMEIIEDPVSGSDFFDKALDEGCEGVMAKNISESSVYQAGSRGWLWIKYKQDYRTELSDTLDLVVIGAFHGTGRRGGTYGALLMAVLDDEENVFRTVCKLGSGFNDDNLRDLVELIDGIRGERNEVWKDVDSRMEPDVFTYPKIVLEVLAAEITFSPIHTCSYGKLKEGTGLALRFPRFTGRFRDDKGKMDATTDREVRRIYSSQKKVLTD
jgi:ATP-dependent DNA ligase I